MYKHPEGCSANREAASAWHPSTVPIIHIRRCRVVTDRETGRPKGFGFCEYFDIPTAASAQRNLNGHEINGRKIHVDFAEDKERGEQLAVQTLTVPDLNQSARRQD